MKKRCQRCGVISVCIKGNRRYCDDCQKLQKAENNRRCREKKARMKSREDSSVITNSNGSSCILPRSAIIKGQSLRLCRDVHNSIVAGRSYGQYMAMKKEKKERTSHEG